MLRGAKKADLPIPQRNSERLLASSVPGGGDEGEERQAGGFKEAEEESADDQANEVGGSGHAAESDTPANDNGGHQDSSRDLRCGKKNTKLSILERNWAKRRGTRANLDDDDSGERLPAKLSPVSSRADKRVYIKRGEKGKASTEGRIPSSDRKRDGHWFPTRPASVCIPKIEP
jgi:hypothetical protein